MGVSYDVAVVGSGPAGALCARRVAESGRSVALLEKSPHPRYKTCGGGLIGRSTRLLGIPLDGIVEERCQAAVMHLAPAGLSLEVERREPLVVMTMRSALDERLYEAARSAGAVGLAPCAVTGLRQESDAVTLETTRGEIRARFVVAADGAGSTVARSAGWTDRPRLAPALESEIRVPAALRRRFAGVARFDLGVIPDGYGWVFPKREHLSVGCLSTGGGRRNLHAELDRYLAFVGVDRIDSREDHGFVIPTRPRPGPLARGRVLLTGDAAGLADPVTCEGISWALASGRLAAAAITTAESATAVCDRYHSSLAREILPDLRTARLLGKLLYGFPRLRQLVVRRLGPSLANAMADVITGTTDYRALFRKPSNYLSVALGFAGLKSSRL